MKLYLAGNFPAMKVPEYEGRLCDLAVKEMGVYRRLVSFHFEPDIQTVYHLLRILKPVEIFLDSGAFSAWSTNTEIKLDDYCDHIKKHKYLVTHYANLDVINNAEASYRNWRRMRAKGFNPIPVYHAETEEKYLEKYLTASDVEVVAIGAISHMSSEARVSNLDYLWRNYLADSDGMPLKKFHGFGLTTPAICLRYPWYSVDSTSWVLFGRYGIVLIPKLGREGWVYNSIPDQIFVSTRSPQQFKIEARHWNSLTEMDRSRYRQYFKEKGYRLGASEVKRKDKGVINETVVTKGLCNDWRLRDELNMIYYLHMENSAPKYPWRCQVEPLPFE
jgi:hypothetical protein